MKQVFAYYGAASYAISVGGNLYAGAAYWRHPLWAIAIASGRLSLVSKPTKCQRHHARQTKHKSKHKELQTKYEDANKICIQKYKFTLFYREFTHF